jgi:murein DD-endopeptidase MepM/ murein hydrolase activator NlpD
MGAKPQFSLGHTEKRPTKIAVKSGDTVYGLAYEHGITSRNLIAANNLTPPYALIAGQELDLPAVQEHVVIEGEDVNGIAAFYGVDGVVLARENRLNSASGVVPGDRLVIPAKDTVARVQEDSTSPLGGSVIASSSLAPLEMDSASSDQVGGRPQFDVAAEISRERMGNLGIQSELQAEINQDSQPLSTTPTDETSTVVPVSSVPEPIQKPHEESKDDSPSLIPTPPIKAVVATAGVAAGAAAIKASSGSSNSAAVPSPVAKTITATVTPTTAPTPTASIPASAYAWPAQGKVLASFGETVNGAKNDGINIALPAGSSVKSAAAGEVVYSGNALKGFGNLVLVKHSDGYMTAYGHNSKLLVKKGDAVVQGQKIAESGSTGDVKSPQLHFELRKGTQPIDPLPKLV